MPLTDTAARNAKSREKPFKLTDSAGLYLHVQPHGAKLWRLAYRFHNKQKTLAFGIYPTISLAQAREKRDEAKKLIANGVDPSLKRKLDKQTALTAVSFRAVADELLAKMQREKRADRTMKKAKWLVGFATSAFGERPVNEISAPELLGLLRKIEANGKYETAIRVRSMIGKIFRYAIATGRAERDPSSDLRGAITVPKVKHRAAIIDPNKIGILLRDIEQFDGYPTTHAALRLAPLLFVRPGELRHAEWSEFDFDAAEWRIPAEKMKMGRVHRVPLSRQAVVILNELKKKTGQLRLLFPSVHSVARPLSENTLNAALRRLGYKFEEMCTHGFRAMAATRLNEMNEWNPDAIERQLAHQEQNAIRRAYTHGAEYWPERVRMMQAWADYLDGLRERGRVVLLSAPKEKVA